MEKLEGHVSNMLSDRIADKKKSMDFGSTILKNLDVY